MRKKLIIIISLVLLVSAYLVFFTPKENDVLYRWDSFSLPSYSHSGEEWKTFGGLEDKWVYGIFRKIGLKNFIGWMEEGKYIGGTMFMNTVTPCYLFPDFLWGFNNLIFSCTVPDGFGTLHLRGFSKYTGEWKDGEKHGQGTLRYYSGGKIVGEWRNGEEWNTIHYEKDGKIRSKLVEGMIRVPALTENNLSGGKYEGEWKDLKWHGQGEFTFSDGRRYVGEWKDGNYHGHGTFTYSDGSEYKGEWKDGKKNGQGIHTFDDGEKYVGEWSKGKLWNISHFDKNGNIIGKWVNGL